jgi:hypothetical protein
MRERHSAESLKSMIGFWERDIYLLRLEEADIVNREHRYRSEPLPLNLPLSEIREMISRKRNCIMELKGRLRTIAERQQGSRRGRAKRGDSF